MTPDEVEKDRADAAHKSLERVVLGALKAAQNAHPEIAYHGYNQSIAKRVAGAVGNSIQSLTAENAALKGLIRDNGTPRFNAVCERVEEAEAENAALKERVLVLTYALDIWEAAYSTGRNEPLVTASETGRAALEKRHDRS